MKGRHNSMSQPLQLKITSRAIYDELQRRGIDAHVVRLSKVTVLLFDFNGRHHAIVGAKPDVSAATSVAITGNKSLTYEIATRYHVAPIPVTEVYHDFVHACDFLQRYQRIVVKPIDGAHGNGVSTNITSQLQLKKAIDAAASHSESKKVLLQEFVQGVDIRVLIIDGTFVGAIRREPASVVGDGIHTIDELIAIENTNSDRGSEPYTKKMNMIDIAAAHRYLTARKRQKIPAIGEYTQVVGTANMGTGGRAVECGQLIPKEMIEQAICMSDIAGAFICGVDFLYDIAAGTWKLIEINASPSFGLHMMPSEGRPIDDLATRYIDALFSKYSKVEI